ncbi:MAG: putative secreted protein, partial [bacterium]|nr:putative secreted protein [bacterium]
NFRAGVIIIPMGIINVYHEPPTFNGVDRPETDTLIIPSTWRESGAGIFGEWRGLRYQAYVVNGFNADGFTASAGLRDGHQEAQLALGHDWGLAARVEHAFPWLYRYGISADAGVSFYYAHADQGQPQFKGSDGDDVPVTMIDGDLRLRTRGLELRAELASVFIGGTHRLNRALAAAAMVNGATFDGPVARQLLGGYVELGYNVLSPLRLRSGRQLVPFLRYEHVDTQYDVAADLGRAPGNRHDSLTAGLTFRPIAEVAVKFDYQHVWTDATVAADADFYRLDLGLAFMF